jgi:TolA-binding protein
VAFFRLTILILLSLVLSGEQLSAASAKEQSAYAAAVAAFQDEMWSRAETELAQFIQKYPKSTNAPEAVLLQAQAQFKQGKLADAIALLGDASHLAKAGTLADQYIYWIGEAQFQNADLTNAAETFVSLAQKFPDSPLRLRAVVEAATAYARIPDWRQHDALLENTNGIFQQVARLDPGNQLIADGQLSLENSKYQQRDFPGVVAVYEWLTNQWQTLNQVQQCQATYLFYRAKMEQGDFAAALEAATNLVQIAGSPTNQEWLATGWASQGATLKRMGLLPEAVQAWGNNLTNTPLTQKREAILNIAELEIVQGQLTNAGQALTNFLAQFPEAYSADIALLTAGELHLKNYAATNQLLAAEGCFDQFINEFTNSPLIGKAFLDRGWCGWLAGDITTSLADFENAAKLLPPSEDLAVARFKTGDAMLALTNYAGALENYRAVLEDFTIFPAVVKTFGDRALYQSLRANLLLTNYDGASNALVRILQLYPASDLATNSALLYGEGLAGAGRPAEAREQFQRFETQFPDTSLRPQVEFAIARTYEQEANWSAAIAGYQGWLRSFPANDLQPQVDYALAWANFRAGNMTNAFGLFTNFVAQFPASELASQAQWWVADYFFNEADYVDAERNYKLFYQNFPTNDYAGQARLMAGRAAVARQGYSDAIDYFKVLEEDTNCPVDLRAQAAFAHGNALMRMDSTDTNNPLANFQSATNVFGQIGQWDPANELVAAAMIEIGNCNLQLTNYDDATNAYAQVVTSTNASMSARSQAQIGIGIALEKKAALASGPAQNELLDQALDNYLDVFDTLNLRDGEQPDLFWRGKAGLQAAPLVGRLNNLNAERKFYVSLKDALPQLSGLIDKKLAALPPEKQ